MKINFKKTLCALLSLIMFMSVGVVHSIALGCGEEITPLSQGNHDWYFDDENNVGAPEGYHIMKCTTCSSTMYEECYVFDCAAYYNTISAKCEVCDITELFPHTFDFVYTGDGTNDTHQLQCVAMGDYGSCFCPYGGHQPCNYPCVWINRAYTSGKGHRLWKQCVDCNHIDSLGYFIPDGHSQGTDLECPYCQMDSSKGEFNLSDLLLIEDELF